VLSRDALCPECGYPLSVSVEEDGETGEIRIVLFCEGPGDDVFSIEILTGLTNDNLFELEDTEGRIVWRKMGVKVRREPEPYNE